MAGRDKDKEPPIVVGDTGPHAVPPAPPLDEWLAPKVKINIPTPAAATAKGKPMTATATPMDDFMGNSKTFSGSTVRIGGSPKRFWAAIAVLLLGLLGFVVYDRFKPVSEHARVKKYDEETAKLVQAPPDPIEEAQVAALARLPTATAMASSSTPTAAAEKVVAKAPELPKLSTVDLNPPLLHTGPGTNHPVEKAKPEAKVVAKEEVKAPPAPPPAPKPEPPKKEEPKVVAKAPPPAPTPPAPKAKPTPKVVAAKVQAPAPKPEPKPEPKVVAKAAKPKPEPKAKVRVVYRDRPPLKDQGEVIEIEDAKPPAQVAKREVPPPEATSSEVIVRRHEAERTKIRADQDAKAAAEQAARDAFLARIKKKPASTPAPPAQQQPEKVR